MISVTAVLHYIVGAVTVLFDIWFAGFVIWVVARRCIRFYWQERLDHLVLVRKMGISFNEDNLN